MKDLYLVDGYNVIFGRPDIFDRSDLESCRKKLMDIMQDYCFRREGKFHQGQGGGTVRLLYHCVYTEKDDCRFLY